MNLLFAWRYFRAKKSTNAIHIIAWVSVIAIIVITASFIVVLSVFNGFEGLVKSLYSSFYPDMQVIARTGKTCMITPAQLEQLKKIQGLKAWSLIAEEKTLLQNGESRTPVLLKGVDENYFKVTGVANKMIRGKFEIGTADAPAIVLGSGIENAVAIESDRSIVPLTAYIFKRGININSASANQALDAFGAENMIPVGAFYIQQDIDNKYSITNLDFMKRMMGMQPNEYTALELALTDVKKESTVKKALEQVFQGNYLVQTKYEQNKSLYSIMNLERWVIYGILTLMLIVAAFTLIGALTMLVLEKQKDIQVLKAMGANNNRIQKIFLNEGFLLAGLGAATGVIIAILICWAQVKFKLIALEGGSFLIDYYPVEMKARDFVLVTATVFVVAGLAAWFPSKKAANQPIELKS